MSFIEIKNVSKSFGGFKVLDNINLSITKPGVYGLLGRNGVGKTTLIKTLIPLIHADEGSIKILGLDPWESQDQLKQQMGYLSDDDNWPKFFSFESLLELYCKLHPTWDKELEKQLVLSFSLDIKLSIEFMSKGQRQMAGLILALCHHPKILILDEPAAGLDVIVRRKMYNTLLELSIKNECCIIFASHILDDVERLVDHVIILGYQNIAEYGPLNEVMERYCQLTVVATEKTLPNQIACEQTGSGTKLILRSSIEEAQQLARDADLEVKDCRSISLEELFVHLSEYVPSESDPCQS